MQIFQLMMLYTRKYEKETCSVVYENMDFEESFSDILKVMRRYSPGQAGDKDGCRCLFVPTELLSTNNALLLHQPDRIYVDILENTVCLLGTIALKVKRQ